jgi:hypothetical protein
MVGNCVTSSADRDKLPLPVLCDNLHDPLRRPVVDPRCLGGSVDRRAVAPCSQHRDDSLDGLCRRTGCNQLRRKLCINMGRLGLRRVLHCLCQVGLYRCRGLYWLGSYGLCPCTGRCKRCDLAFCTLSPRLRRPLHRWTWCIGGSRHGAGAACWFVPECNQHQGADGNCCVDDCREKHP